MRALRLSSGPALSKTTKGAAASVVVASAKKSKVGQPPDVGGQNLGIQFVARDVSSSTRLAIPVYDGVGHEIGAVNVKREIRPARQHGARPCGADNLRDGIILTGRHPD